jgi:DNA-binding HxlR family transcriptional regulator
MGTIQVSSRREENNNTHDLAGTMKSLEAECKTCSPSSPLECITRCHVYKVKNELRRLRETMDNPNYIKDLFNVLKNYARFLVLQEIAKSKCSAGQLCLVLRKAGCNCSPQSLREEYLKPLIRAGLAAEVRDEYCTTLFGNRVAELLGHTPKFAQMLPANSECYEETLLQSLLAGPKTFENIEDAIPPKTTSRTLKRLRLTGLIETPAERDYVFFFKTIRDLNKEITTASQREVYGVLREDGSSAGQLSKDSGLSLRRTYRCIKGLKGKKLIFLRRTPKLYALTGKGEELALVLRELDQIVEDTRISSKIVMPDSAYALKERGLPSNVFLR